MAGDGGTITNPADNAISLVNTSNHFFRGLLVNGTGGHGVFGTGMTDGSGGAEATLEFRNSRFISPGDADNESGLHFGTIASLGNNSGSIVLADVIVEMFEDQGFEAVNNTGSLTISITGTPSGLTNSTTKFDDNNDTHGTSGILVVSMGTSSMTVNVTGVYFNNIEAEAIMLQSTASTSSIDVNLLNNISINGGGPDNFPSGGGFAIVQDASGSATFDIKGNNIRDLQGDAIVIIADGPSQGRIGGSSIADGNVISGTLVGDCIRIDTDQLLVPGPGPGDNFTVTILIQNNQIGNDATFPGIGDDGIQILHRDGTKTLNLTIENNTIANTASEALRYFQDADISDGALKPYGAVRVASNTMTNIGTAGAFVFITQDTADLDLHVTGNTFPAAGNRNISLSQAGTSVLQITQASVAALAAANTNSTASSAGTITFHSPVTNPSLPSNPLLFAPGGVSSATPCASDVPGVSLPTPPAPPTAGLPARTTDPAPAANSAPATVVDDVVLSAAELNVIVQSAISRWTATGLTADQLAALNAVTFEVTPMNGWYLGSAAGNLVQIDSDAGGFGWFVDATPLDDSEYPNAVSATRLYTDPTLAPAGKIDLLTTVMHEMGHMLGLEDSYSQQVR